LNILATICARGGSKGVNNKNIRKLNNRPLIYYTIDILQKWNNQDRIILSTDSKEIIEVAEEFGLEVPFVRPKELATDEAPKLPVIQHATKFAEEKYDTEYDVIVDLDPTAPIRKLEDLDNALDKFREKDSGILYSVTKSRKNPYFNMVELDENGYAHLSKDLDENVTRRQEAPQIYSMNASIYIYDRDFLLNAESIHDGKEIVYVMDDIAAFDIDREIDFKFIEFLIEEGVFEFE